MTPHPVDLEALESLFKEWKADRIFGAPWPLESFPWWTLGDRFKVAAVNALPALLAEVRAARQADWRTWLENAANALKDASTALFGAGFKKASGDAYSAGLVALARSRPDAALASPSVPPPQEKVQEAVADAPAPLACYHCGQPLSGPAGCLHCKDHHHPAPPEKAAPAACQHNTEGPCAVVTVEKAALEAVEETAALKDGVEARIISWTCHICDAGGTATESMSAHFATHGIGRAAFDRRSVSEQPTAGPPSAPALPKEEVAPSALRSAAEALAAGRDGAASIRGYLRQHVRPRLTDADAIAFFDAGDDRLYNLHWNLLRAAGRAAAASPSPEHDPHRKCASMIRRLMAYTESALLEVSDPDKESAINVTLANARALLPTLAAAPVPLPEEQLPQEGSAAAPAPGDAQTLSETLADCINGEASHKDCRSTLDHINAFAARVRSEERAGIVEEINSYRGRLAANEAYNAKKLSAVDAILSRIRIRARASDATSAGGGERG